MNWDPSMATHGCSRCGKGIEAWILICEECEELEIKEIEKRLGINEFPDAFLEIYSRNKNTEMIIKCSSPGARYDMLAAIKMRKWFEEQGIKHIQDPESDRTVIIPMEDYIRLFGYIVTEE